MTKTTIQRSYADDAYRIPIALLDGQMAKEGFANHHRIRGCMTRKAQPAFHPT